MSKPLSLLACLLLVGSLQRAHAEETSKRAGVLPGIDVLIQSDFQPLRGRKVGLITNHTGTSIDGTSTAEVLYRSDAVELVALFSPEHGIAGKLDQPNIDDMRDPETSLPVYSLYGARRKPTRQSLRGIDTLVFDIQDIGTRFYTYISTMGEAMEAAAEAGIRFVVLDRPNPIGGVDVAGPVTDPGLESFVAYHSLSLRHGMTVGELARMFAEERGLDLDLVVVPVKGWSRDKWFDALGLRWTNPSPNMRSLTQATLYPGIGIIETTNVSVGRGTDTPFELFGAPWIDELELAAKLNAAQLGGVTFVPIRFTPDSSKHATQDCGGVQVLLTNRSEFDPVALGLCVAATLRKLYPDAWDTNNLNRLLCDQATLSTIVDGATWSKIHLVYEKELEQFKMRRRKYLIPEYQPVGGSE